MCAKKKFRGEDKCSCTWKGRLNPFHDLTPLSRDFWRKLYREREPRDNELVLYCNKYNHKFVPNTRYLFWHIHDVVLASETQ